MLTELMTMMNLNTVKLKMNPNKKNPLKNKTKKKNLLKMKKKMIKKLKKKEKKKKLKNIMNSGENLVNLLN